MQHAHSRHVAPCRARQAGIRRYADDRARSKRAARCGQSRIGSPRDIQRAVERRAAVVYTPWFWRLIMLIIRLMPRFLFNRLKI